MSDYDAIVIGSGCGGMTSAVTMAQGGLKVLLLERHNIPGGCATSFYRGRFEFEASLHQLSGIGTEDNPGQVRQILHKMGVLDRVEMVQEDMLYNVQINGGVNIDIPANRKELLKTLTDVFPNDHEEIENYIKFLYGFMQQYGAVVFARDPEASPEKYPLFFKYMLRNTQEVLDEFISNPELQICFGPYIGYMGLPTETLPFIQLASCFWSYIEFKPTHFVGGSQALSNALIDCFREAGGTVRFNCGVESIQVSDGQITGVITDDGQKITSNMVVSNASPIDTYMKMIDRQHVPQTIIDDMNSKELSVSAFTVYLGLDCTPEDLGISTPGAFLFDKGAVLNDIYGDLNKKPASCGLTCYNKASPSFSPDGTCQLVLIDLQYGEPWQSISEHEYTDVKYRYADQLIELAEKFYPTIRDHIEEVEISTPLTHARYLSTPSGSIYGYSPHLKDSKFFDGGVDRSIKGLAFAGSWVAGGGYEPSLTSGVLVGRSMVKQFHKAGAAQ